MANQPSKVDAPEEEIAVQAEPAEEQIVPSEWRVDFAKWVTMAPIMAWQRAARLSDFDALAELMSQVIRSWPYDPNPRKVESYGQLTREQYKEALSEVGARVGRFFRD